MRMSLVLLLSLTGVVMGALTSLVGLGIPLEPIVWTLAYVGWGVVVVTTGAPKPFQTILVASLLTGLWCGVVQTALFDSYVVNNAEAVADLEDPSRAGAAPILIGFGVVMGLIYGAITGAVAAGLSKRGRPDSTSPDHPAPGA